jgi:hypothetical protein
MIHSHKLETNSGVDTVMCGVEIFRIVHLASLALGLFPPPTSPSSAHCTAREVRERPTWHGTDWALYDA